MKKCLLDPCNPYGAQTLLRVSTKTTTRYFNTPIGSPFRLGHRTRSNRLRLDTQSPSRTHLHTQTGSIPIITHPYLLYPRRTNDPPILFSKELNRTPTTDLLVMYGSSTVHQPSLPIMDDTKSPTTTTTSTNSSAVTSNEVSPAYYKFEDPSIDTILTPLTSVEQTPVNEKDEKFVQTSGEGVEVELEELERRVRESCEGRSSVIEAWGHRGASATWRECYYGLSGAATLLRTRLI